MMAGSQSFLNLRRYLSTRYFFGVEVQVFPQACAEVAQIHVLAHSTNWFNDWALGLDRGTIG